MEQEQEEYEINYQTLIDKVNETNAFAREMGMQIVCMRRGYAEVELQIRPEHLNPYRTVHGGVLYTIADVTGGSAAISYGDPIFTANSDFHFLNVGKDVTCLYAVAEELKAGKKLMVYDVLVKDQNGKALCKGTFTYVRIPEDKAGFSVKEHKRETRT